MRMLGLLVLFVSIPYTYSYASCDEALAAVVDAGSVWRMKITHPLAQKKLWPTDAAREKEIQEGMDHMIKEMNGVYAGHPDTPPMVLIPTRDTKIKFTKPWEEYSPMVADVIGAKDGVLRATVLLPVSAHTGLADAKKWAKTDTYSLTYDNGSGKEITIVKDAASLDMVTTHEIEVPLIDGKEVILYYYRSGSGGPSGYDGGRTLKLTWQKNKVYNSPSKASNKF